MKQALPFILLLFSFTLAASAKTDKKAKNILDKTAAALKKAGDIETQFTATSFKGEKETGRMTGKLYLHKEAFHLVSDKVIYWYDGKTMWNFVKENNEVNISNPPFYDQQAMNPYTVISLYSKGYEYDYGESTLRGKSCYCIHLRSIEKTQKIKEMYLDIDKTTFYPVCIRMRRGNDGWTRVSIHAYRDHQKYNEDKFRFKKEEYPSAEIIDLR